MALRMPPPPPPPPGSEYQQNLKEKQRQQREKERRERQQLAKEKERGSVPIPEREELVLFWVENFSSLTASAEIMEGQVESDIFDTDWKTMKSCRISDEGSGGVMFVTRKNESIVCVKGGIGVLAEVFTTQLALRANISVPRVRVISGMMQEMEMLRLYVKKNRNPDGRIYRMMKKAALIVMEHVEGKPPWGWPQHEMEKLLDPLTPFGRSRLREFGRLMALDVTVNNLDRFPLIWNNSGNIANVLFQLEKESEGLVVGIDNECVCIKKKFDQFGKYLEKVKRLVHHLINTPKEEFSGMTTVREQFKMFTNYQIPKEGGIEMQVGVIEGMHRFSCLTFDDLSDLKQKLAEWDPSLEDPREIVDLEFLGSVISIFRQHQTELLVALDTFENVKPYLV